MCWITAELNLLKNSLTERPQTYTIWQGYKYKRKQKSSHKSFDVHKKSFGECAVPMSISCTHFSI